MKINLTAEPEMIHLKSQPFLYLEKRGPFLIQAPKAWQEFHEITTPVMKTLSVTAMCGLSRTDESRKGDDRFIYQAGLFLNDEPVAMPPGLHLRTVPAGKYARFVLTGSYHQLSEAYPQIFSILEHQRIPLRDEFCAEVYLNTPGDTAEADLKTEILIPV